jgi:hypothetical protein
LDDQVRALLRSLTRCAACPPDANALFFENSKAFKRFEKTEKLDLVDIFGALMLIR